DPFCNFEHFLDTLKSLGFAGIQNFPTVGLIDGNFRANLEETGMGYGLEVDLIRLARSMDLLTTPYVFNESEARAMADAGADINGHHSWHPLIAESHIEDGKPSDQVGCVRNFKLTNGGHLRERLLSFSDLDRTFIYNILESPLPLSNYVATFHCAPITEGNKT